jgi:hypothetical protein
VEIPRTASRPRTGSDQDPGEETPRNASFLAGMSPVPTFPPSPWWSNPSLRRQTRARLVLRQVRSRNLCTASAVPTIPILRTYALLLFGPRLEAVALRESRTALERTAMRRGQVTLPETQLALAALDALASAGLSAAVRP